ncbi:MAG: ABC-F family ATP-binding cassette domain-containing protein [Alphaproteobacteria bacterium]|jgi:ATP-binding cassette subfamily F protein uup|nr:ABC-F family ATP-binding cassette domain-containing protein [Alphaproteobacteria bacterium]
MALPPLISLRDISLTFGGKPLFEGLFNNISKGDKTCLVGRNGSGKSTFLKIVCGQMDIDNGERFVQPGTRISYLPQDVWLEADQTPKQFVMQSGCAPFEADEILDLLKMDRDRMMDGFSGGERRRVALARALVGDPDVLLLDEPTNHLDLPTIEWLEEYLRQYTGALLSISHDRTFLERVSTSCLWLDRGLLHRHNKGFADFENWSDHLLAEEEKTFSKMNTKLKQEMEWLHRGVTARRKRNQGRLRQLHTLREEKRAFLSGQIGKLKMAGADAEGGSRLVIEAKSISKTLGGKPLIQDFSTRILRGDRIGIIGPNGTGKTTLIRMLAGVMPPDSGTVRLGTNIDLIYFDQLRDTLKPNDTLWQTLCDTGGDHVLVQGQPRHVMAYLKDFLFEEKQARSPVSILSGGEKNRLALAKALTRPGNVLILDEPTNDLDMDTLDLLIEMVSDFTGTLLIVSHDRDFLDRLTTSIIALEGDGLIRECVGGYQDYIRQFPHQKEAVKSLKVPKEVVERPKQIRKITYNEKREYDLLPARMDELMKKISTAEARLEDPSFYQNHPQEFMKVTEALTKAKEELARTETRWLELDEVMTSSS